MIMRSCAITALARSLNLSVVAEGIELTEQLESLRRENATGCRVSLQQAFACARIRAIHFGAAAIGRRCCRLAGTLRGV